MTTKGILEIEDGVMTGGAVGWGSFSNLFSVFCPVLGDFALTKTLLMVSTASLWHPTFGALVLMESSPFNKPFSSLEKEREGPPTPAGIRGNIYCLSGCHYLRIQFYELPNLLA